MKRLLLLLAAFLIPSIAAAQGGGQYTDIRSSAEPLPNCIPATQPYQAQPMVWDVTAQALKICTAPNIWTTVPNSIGTGTVSVVTVSGTTTPLFNVTVNTPTTTPQIVFMIPTQSPNLFYAGPPSGGAAVATFRAIVNADLPVINLANTPLTTNGDLLTVIGGLLSRLPQGANGTFLGVSGGLLQYITPAGAGNVTTGTATLDAVMIGGGGTAINPLASLGLNGNALISAGAGNPPAFGQLNLANANAIIGNLPITSLCSGTGAGATTFLRGDCSWQVPSVPWNSIGNPTGNLALTMATNTSTFNQTNAAVWTWQNVTAAVSGTPQNSPIMTLAGRYFTGAASATDSWAQQLILGTANNGTSTLTFTHSGSSGLAGVSVPNLYITSLTSVGNCLTIVAATGQIGSAACGGAGGSTLTVNGGSAISAPNLQNDPTGYNGLFANFIQNVSNVNVRLSGTLGIAAGGTGQITAIAAFNALTPMNTTGDQEIFNAGTAQRVAIGANGFCWVSNGTIPIWQSCPGGLANPMTTLYDMIVGGVAGAPTRLAAPTTPAGVPQQLIDVPGSAQAWATAGVPVNVQSGTSYNLALTDRATLIDWANTSNANIALPLISTAGFGGNFVMVVGGQRATAQIALTPTSPNTFNGGSPGAAEIIYGGWASFVYQDNGGTNWRDLNFPTKAAFPAGGCTILGWSGTVFGCTTNPAAGSVPFSGIITSTNTGATMTLSSSASFVFTSGAVLNASGMTGANQFLLPVIAGALPTTNGAIAFDPTSQTWRATVSGGTNLIPTIATVSIPVAGNCAQWGPNATLAAAANPCGTGGGSGSGQIDFPVYLPVRADVFGFSITAATTVGNSGTPTTLIGAATGRQVILAGGMIPGTFGPKTVKIHAVGTIGTNSSNFGLTVNIILGGVTVGSITAPTVASLSGAGWELNYDFTVTGLTTANGGGCMHIVNAASAELIGCSSSASITGLNFITNQTSDVQVVWTMGNAANTITVNSLTENVDQGN